MAKPILSKSTLTDQTFKISHALEKHLLFVHRLYSIAERLYSEIRDIEGILIRNPEDYLNPELRDYQLKRIEQLLDEFAKITDTQQEVA